jgi:hypothetical protein
VNWGGRVYDAKVESIAEGGANLSIKDERVSYWWNTHQFPHIFISRQEAVTALGQNN